MNNYLSLIAEEATIKSLQKRIDFWNGVYEEINIKKTALAGL